MDFMSGGQALQIAEHAVDNLVKICLYDMGWLASKRIIPTLLSIFSDQHHQFHL